MFAMKRTALLWLAAGAAGTFAGCECGKEGGSKPQDTVERTVSLDQPELPKPVVEFPESLQCSDPTVNAFIREALQTCVDGQYESFRSLFGTSYTPTGYEDFERLWKRVFSIRVAGLTQAAENPPRYYMQVGVTYREEDRRGRSEREVIVMIYREGDHWRLAPAPSEALERFEALTTQPADQEDEIQAPSAKGDGTSASGRSFPV